MGSEKERKRDSVLVKRLKAGDKGALWDLMIRYEKRIYGFCYRMLQDEEAAYDVAKDTFIKIFENIHQLRGGFKAWLYTIARNRCIDEIKKSKRVEKSLSDELSKQSNNAPERIVENKEIAAIVKEELNKLNPIHKEVILLVHYEGLSYKEASEILHIPIGTVRSRLNRGLEILRDRLKHIKMQD